MNKFYLIFIIIFSIGILSAQPEDRNSNATYNFYNIRDAYLQKLKSEKNNSDSPQNFDNDGLESKFRRWEYMMEPRVFPGGKLPGAGYLLDEMNKYYIKTQNLTDTLTFPGWKSLEQSSGFPDNGYAGRVNCICFHPKDSNIIFIGAPAGGLWKTNDGGSTWFPLTDRLPSLGVSDIVINPDDPNIMYMATGDRDAANFISNPYSYGLLKSTDGGYTWQTIGLNHIFSDQMTIQRLLIHPKNSHILMAAVTGVNGNLRGIWRTTDDGTTWTNVAGGAKYTLEFNPGDPNIVYTSGWKYFARSTDAGATWTVVNSSVLPYSSVTSSKIAVTPANPHIVMLQFLDPNTGYTYGLYKSYDDGKTWKEMNRTPIPTQDSYDWVLQISPVDTNIVLNGFQNLYRSNDGGTYFDMIPNGHVDHHAIVYSPINNALYDCNDGGIYKSYSNGDLWVNLNKTLQIFQYYRLSNSAGEEDFILTGAQDNGVNYHKLPQWMETGLLADGAECIIDYSNPQIYYYSFQYGFLYRTGYSGNTFSLPPVAGRADNCAWITPYLIHPSDPSKLYFGAKDIFFTSDRGANWSNYSMGLTLADKVGGGMLRAMAISESKPDSVLYAASYVVVYKTTDGGTSWQNITSNLPTSAGCFDCSAISSIAVHPQNSNIVWVTMSGYSANNRVFKTTDGGSDWVNISDNLPAIPVNTIVYEKNSNDALYIGTDAGVFYRDASTSGWMPYMNELPNVPVQELEIQYRAGKLRAATFGRGLWETDTYSHYLSVGDAGREQEALLISSVPNSGYIELHDKFCNPETKISILTLPGNELMSCPAEKRISISNLSSGVYIAKIGMKTQKFIVCK